jgi:DNA polymerase alpha-associated DNA helicase A
MKRLIDELGDKSTCMLTTQYRMNSTIMQWISMKLYDSKLEAHQSVANHLLTHIPNVESDDNTSKALVLIDTDGCDMDEMVIDNSNNTNGDEESKANEGEANIVCR